MNKNVVHRIEEGMDRRDVYATTYQMRNFYVQLRDAMPDQLERVQLHPAPTESPSGASQAHGCSNVCCGRGLMLPLLRYHAKHIDCYVGVDLHRQNVRYLTHRVTNGKALAELSPPTTAAAYYPFGVHFVEANAAEMAAPLQAGGHPPFERGDLHQRLGTHEPPRRASHVGTGACRGA